MIFIVVNLFISLALANDSPYANINEQGNTEIIDSKTVHVCQELILSGQFSRDNDGNIVAYNWYEGDKLLLSANTVSLKIKDTTTREVKLVVTDNGGKTDESILKIYAHSTVRPHIKSLIDDLEEDEVYVTDEFTVTARLPELPEVDITWNFDSDIVEKIKEQEKNRRDINIYTITLRAKKAGNTEIAISAKNICQEEASEKIDFRISSSQIPEIKRINIPDDIREGKRIEISAEVSNFEEEYQYLWTVRNIDHKDREEIYVSENLILRLDEGFYEINLTLTNKEGVSDFKHEALIVPNTENDQPVADASATDKNAILDEIFILNGSRSHDDGEVVSYSWWHLNKGSKKYERICIKNNPVCEFLPTRTGEEKFYLIVNDDNISSPESKKYKFTVQVIASQEDEIKEQESKKETIELRSYQASQRHVSSEGDGLEDVEDELERLGIPGFEFLGALLAIIIAGIGRKRLGAK